MTTMECKICFDDEISGTECFACMTCNFTVCQYCYTTSVNSLPQVRICFNAIEDKSGKNTFCEETVISSLKRPENIPCIKVYLKHGIRENFIQNFPSILAYKHFINDELYFDDLISMVNFKNKLIDIYQKEDIISLAPIIANFNTVIKRDDRVVGYHGHATIKRLLNKKMYLTTSAENDTDDANDFVFGNEEDVDKFNTSDDPVFSGKNTKKTIVNKKCMVANCSGTLYSDKNICMVCSKITCNVCLIEKTEDHVCIKEENEVFANSRQCDICSMIIFRIQGCNHMTCGSCGFRFNWETGVKLGFAFDGSAYGFNSFKGLNVLKSEAFIIADANAVKKISAYRKDHGIDPFRIRGTEYNDLIEILLSSVYPYVTSEKLDELKEFYFSKITHSKKYEIYAIFSSMRDSLYCFKSQAKDSCILDEYKKKKGNAGFNKDIFLISHSMRGLIEKPDSAILKVDSVHLKYMTQTRNLAHWNPVSDTAEIAESPAGPAVESSSENDHGVFTSWFRELIEICLENSCRRVIFNELNIYIETPTPEHAEKIISLIRKFETFIEFKFNITSLNFAGFNFNRRLKAQIMMM